MYAVLLLSKRHSILFTFPISLIIKIDFMQNNTEKNRKSEAQKQFDEADNAGRFAGDNTDAKAAREQAIENIRLDTTSRREERNKSEENTDSEARRDPAQTHDYKGEAQNVNIDPEHPGKLGGNNRDTEHARKKAMEGIQQDRDASSSGNTDRNSPHQ